MNKLLTKIVGVALGATMAVGVGVAAVKASDGGIQRAEAATDATMAPGTNGSAATVNGKDAIKVGTSKAGGSMTITVGSGATSLSFYAVAWKGVTGLSLNLTGATASVDSFALTADDGATNNSPFTLSGQESDYLFTTSLTGITSDTIITLTSSIAKRFVVWGATYETGGTPTPVTLSVTYDPNGADSGNVPTDSNEYEFEDTVTVLGNSGNLAKTDYVFAGWNTEADGTGTTYIEGNQFDIQANTTLYAIWELDIDDDTDYLNLAFTGVPAGQTYVDWADKTGQSGAVYAGNSAGDHDSIQLRSKNNNSGVITTTSGGNVKKVSVVWDGNNAANRTVDIYGKDSAYSSPADLFDSTSQGTLLGSIVYGTSTELSISGDYRHVGIRSNDGAVYLTSIKIKWEAAALDPKVTLDKESITLKTTDTDGLTVTATVEDVASPTYSWVSNNQNVTLSGSDTKTVTIKPNTNSAASSTVTLTVGGTSPALTASVDVTIRVPGHGETSDDPFTVAEARAHIAEVIASGTASGDDGRTYYAQGVVSEIVTPFDSRYGNITYNISADGLTTGDQLQSYRGKSFNGENFVSENDVKVGDEVVIFGSLTKHNETYEFAADNQLYSLNRPTPTPTTSGWVLTNITDLTTEDVFVIVGTQSGDNYAMTNDNGTASAPAVSAVTIEDDMITSEVSDNIKWNISGNGTDGYTFYPNGSSATWLYCTNSNNGVRVGTNTNKTFTINSGYLYHTGTSRYVGIYNAQDWRCYTSINSNIENESFAFYKYVEASSYTAADFAKELLKQTKGLCNADYDGEDNHDALAAIWSTLSGSNYWGKVSNQSALTGGTADSSVVVPTTDEAIEAMTDTAAIGAALYRYDFCTDKYKLTDFMGRVDGTNRINPINKVNNTVAIVVVVTISLVSVSALGAYFLLRKKKEER